MQKDDLIRQLTIKREKKLETITQRRKVSLLFLNSAQVELCIWLFNFTGKRTAQNSRTRGYTSTRNVGLVQAQQTTGQFFLSGVY